MRVILLEDVAHVGHMGEIVRVSNGYGRNFLIPQGMAVLATEQRAKAFAHQKAMVEHKKAKLHKAAIEQVTQLNGLSLSVSRAASQEGKLHGSVTNRDIADLLAAKGVEIDKRKIVLEQPIREIGEYAVEIKLTGEVSAKVKVDVTALA